MKIEQKIVDRLNQLINTEADLAKTRKEGFTQGAWQMHYDYIDKELASQWGISCLSILSKIFGENSDHYKRFNELFEELSKGDVSKAKMASGILKAAKDDYENGYLFDTRALIEAEVFDDFLEQAEHLLKQGYHGAAAVVAGCVLEDGLRKLCARNGITLSAKPKLNTMNADLVKARVYNLLKQKQITALADLRNKASHGKWTEFDEKDVEAMIRDARRFMEDYFS